MENFNYAKGFIGLWGLAILLFVSSCTQFEGADPAKDSAVSKSLSSDDPNARVIPASSPTSIEGIVPAIIAGANEGGNRTCEEVAAAFSSPEVLDEFGNVISEAVVVEFTGEGDGERRNWTGSGFDGTSWPEGFTVNVTDGKFIDWSYLPPPGYCLKNLAFIVKGSDQANVYYYDGDAIVYSDGGLASPPNASGGPAGLSNLTICYSIEPCDTVIEEDCESDETAWASRAATYDKYNPLGGGNWATWVNYTGVEQTFGLFAGQFYNIGNVKLEPANGGSKVKITITMTNGAFQPVSNNVKIQGYTSAPSGNPSPGLFKTSKGTATGTTYTVTVNRFAFYGIHVDAIRYYTCPAVGPI